jgi:hypothetical protein
VKPLIAVAGEVEEVNVVAAGLVLRAVQIPVPVAAIVAVEY